LDERRDASSLPQEPKALDGVEQSSAIRIARRRETYMA